MLDVGIAMNAMRDVAGIPAYPIIFQSLMILTWMLHIAFVHLSLGACATAIVLCLIYKEGNSPHYIKLSIALTQVAKVSVSLLIVMGVAPLLFTQVIYDPQWYTSNILSGRWVIAFIFILIIAYCLWFVFYYVNKEGAKKHILIYVWISFALFCVDGLIMHVLSYQAILPNEWMNWYAPDSVVDTSGSALHAVQWPRYFFIMILSIPAVGAFLIAYSHYFKVRQDYSASYLNFCFSLGKKLFQIGYFISLFPFLAWQFVLPEKLNLFTHPLGWILMLIIAALIIWSYKFEITKHGYFPALGGLIFLSLLALWREIIRVQYLKPFGYNIHNYPVNVDWPSSVLFLCTFIGVGGIVGSFYLSLIYRSGRTQGILNADRSLNRLGTGAVALLLVWIAVFFAYGIVIWVNNNFI